MASGEGAAVKRRMSFPFMEGILPVRKGGIPVDVIAGCTLAALAIPEVMGYTKIAGMPVITGLYTILVPIAIFALFGSSRHLVVGADSATAAIMFAGMTGLATPNTPQWVAMASWCAILTALLLLIARLLKLGFLADFLSRTVLIGFLTGVGIQVACGQIAGMLGVPKSSAGPIVQALAAIQQIPQASIPTVVVSASVFVLIVGGGFLNKKVPWALIAVVGTIAASWYWDLVAKGVTTLGTVPSGLPHFGVPAMPVAGQWTTLVTTSMSLFIVVLAQSAATSRAYAVRYNDRFDENTDLVGLGLANLGAGLTGTFVVNGSPTKTAMVVQGGGRRQLSQLVTAAIVLVVLLFLTRPLSYMPKAVLSAVVFLIGVKLVDVKGMRKILRSRIYEFGVATATAASVVLIGVEQGIIVAIVLSIVIHLRHSYRPSDKLLVRSTAGRWSGKPLASGAQAAPGLAIYRFGASMYYANSNRFAEEIRGLRKAAEPKLQWLCIVAEAIIDVDYTGSALLRTGVERFHRHGITVVLCEVPEEVKAELDKDGLTELIGEDNFYGDIDDVMEAYNARTAGARRD